MPFCPECRGEYRSGEFRAGVSRCAECGVLLVDELPPEPEVVWDATDWVTVEEVGDDATAAIIEGFLLEQGFPVRVLAHRDRELVMTLGELSSIEVQVPVADLEGALAALDERETSGPEPEGTGEPDEEVDSAPE
jgi:hypothetical protein